MMFGLTTKNEINNIKFFEAKRQVEFCVAPTFIFAIFPQRRYIQCGIFKLRSQFNTLDK